MSKKKGGMVGGPAEQADHGTHGAFHGEPDVRIPPHETEGSWSIGEREKKTPTAEKRAEKSARKTPKKKE